jgi:hypothetical protein
MTSKLTDILSEHLSGKPIDRGVWQNLDNGDRIQLSEAIVAGKAATANEVRICSYGSRGFSVRDRSAGAPSLCV